MKCPNCKEINLVMSERQSIEIDYCPECRGIWLDRGELDKLLEKSKLSEPVVRQEQATYEQSHREGQYQKPYKRKKSFLEDLFD